VATIIDSLVVTLGLDGSGFEKGSRQSREAVNRTKQDALSAAKEMESAGKRGAQFFSQMRNEAVGLFAAFAGASSIVGFATSVVTAAADTGRLGTNIGVATERLSVWEGVVQKAGGKAGEASNTMKGLAKIYQDYRMGIAPSANTIGLLSALGVSLGDLKEPEKAMMKFAEARDRLTAPEFYAKMSALGIPDSVINSYQQGSAALRANIAEQEKLAPITKQDADEAIALERSLATLKQQLMSGLRPAIIGVVSSLSSFFSALSQDGLYAFTDAIGELGHAFAKLASGDVSGFFSSFGEVKRTRRRGLSPAFDAQGTGGGGGPAGPVGSQGRGNANFAGDVNFFKQKGYTDRQARGIAAGIQAEGGVWNQSGGYKGRALGIGQWLGPRKAQIKAMYGPNPTRNQQLQFMAWEMEHTEKGAGNAIKDTGSEYSAMHRYITRFMRPAAGRETAGDLARGSRALGIATTSVASRYPSRGGGGGGASSTSIGTIVIHTPHSHAPGIAKDIKRELSNRQVVHQANRGLS
jgi:Phage tail lysozyme